MNKSEQIESFILKKIDNKEYEPGAKIPTEAELIEQFSVSRMTVNRALSALRNKGYIYSIRGKGTFVKREAVQKKLNVLTSFTEEMKSRGITPITKTLEFAYTSMGFEEEKEKLGLRQSDSVYKVIRVRYNGDLPLALDVTLLNEKVIGPMEFSQMGSSLYEYIEKEAGIQIDYSLQRIKAVKADEFISRHLEIAEGEPVLLVSNVTYDTENRPFEMVHTYYVHDAYEFEQICTRS
jgi:GntR family transcriptional regulator